MGAIATGGVRVLNEDTVRRLGISDEDVARIIEHEERELARRERLFRGGRPPPRIQGRTAILVDDGLATGSTMRAAVLALREQEPARLVVGVPVGAPETCAAFQDEADEVVCALSPEPFYAVGHFYEDFSQTSDEEVRELLVRAGALAHEVGTVPPGS